ncbi:Phage shock protein A [Lachnospiraceae bacterium TWA4]|nr:Phage shock protein A [Lachnospiraceae bacterium TWA4]
MGIIQRFKDIMSSNINALLDKAEDPEKMVDQYLRNLESDLGKVKAETAAVMAEETRTKRALDECVAEIAKMQSYAEKAIVAGNDEDAKAFLTKKATLTANQATLQQNYELAAANAQKMRQMHDKLVADISQLNSRKAEIKAKVQMAKAQERINKMTSGVNSALDSASGAMSAFDRMDQKANQMLDQANAMAELNKVNETNDVDALARKYDSEPTTAVDDELALLKAKLGK